MHKQTLCCVVLYCGGLLFTLERTQGEQEVLSVCLMCHFRSSVVDSTSCFLTCICPICHFVWKHSPSLKYFKLFRSQPVGGTIGTISIDFQPFHFLFLPMNVYLMFLLLLYVAYPLHALRKRAFTHYDLHIWILLQCKPKMTSAQDFFSLMHSPALSLLLYKLKYTYEISDSVHKKI